MEWTGSDLPNESPATPPVLFRSPAELRHDLRTPLNQVIGYSEMLLEDTRDQELADLHREIEGVHFAAYDLVKRIQELLPAHVQVGPEIRERIQQGLAVPSNQLHFMAHQLAARNEELLHPFAAHIETAARELLQLVHGEHKPHSPVATAPAPEEVEGTARARLLVVDDSERNREVLRHQLERQGYSVHCVASGLEAIKLLKQRPVDLVLLDVLMPELDGFATLETIKDDPDLREIPVIMISASDEYQSVIRCIEGGAEDYLPKPFDPVLLRARLKASLEKKLLRDEQRRKTKELEKAYSDLQNMQDQLITQEKLASLGALAAGIAHEIKNPLNFVTNFAALSSDLISDLREASASGNLEDWNATVSDLEANIHRIEEHGLRADRIVRGMLAHARKESGQREEANFNSIVKDCVKLAFHGLRSQDASFNSAIDLELDPAVGNVDVFPQDLSRVFLNITTNAFHAVHQKKQRSAADYQPRVRVWTLNVESWIETRIWDNGDGIPAALTKRIFEPFFTTKPAGAGTGLGLSISQEVVVKEHHGELTVNSVEGEFSEFTIRIPREVAPR